VTGFARHALRTLVVESAGLSKSTFGNEVWNLNLDQIEQDTGRILSKQMVPTERLGPSTYPFETGTVLYSKLRPYLNKVVVAEDSGVATTELVPLICNPELLLPQYLALFLRSKEFLQFANTVVAGAKMPRMVMSEFWEYKLPVPDLAEQRRIAAILDQADALRAKRREALAQLDRLAQSIFVEMFGDPEEPTGQYPQTTLGELCRRVTDGTHQSPTWVSEGIPFLFISNIVNGKINFDTDKYISRETYEELTRRCPIEKGDVLYTTVGSYGNSAVVSGDEEFCFQRHIAHIKPDPAKLDSVFCAAMIESPGVRRQVDKVARGVAQKTVNLSDLKALKVFAPDLSVQRLFTQKIANLQRLKDQQLMGLAQSDDLFRAIQHRAFRGEL
jgi:type I restriction enzyme S subunit